MALEAFGTLGEIELHQSGAYSEHRTTLVQVGQDRGVLCVVSYKIIQEAEKLVGKAVKVALFQRGVPYTKDGEKKAFVQSVIVGISPA